MPDAAPRPIRLKQIKLSGFKSFPDLETIEFRAPVTAVVGPNGCGKSNLVDAVRWVLGETSRHIRAATLDEVVFSGSATRKPAGLASVELVFDNADGFVGGRYASCPELSLCRKVDRDRESQYFLNGARCRRRDIVDVFFGTGLTGGGYAVIEQGTVSRIVEAKPEDMRAHVEEAAGLSRYKSRRRETENRMRHVRDNLARVADIREELDRQLRKLKRQAGEAARYSKLKQRKKRLLAEVNALRLRDATRAAEALEERASAERVRIDGREAAVAKLEAEKEQQRARFDAGVQACDDARETSHRLGARAAELEREARGRRERAEQLRLNLEEGRASCEQNAAAVEAQSARHDELREQGETLGARVQALGAQVDAKRAEFEAAAAALADSDAAREKEAEARAALAETAKVEGAKVALYREEMTRLDASLKELQAQAQACEPAQAEREQQARERACEELRAGAAARRERIEEHSAALARIEESLGDCRARIEAGQRDEHDLRGRLASLDALQKDALGRSDEALADWLKQAGLADAGRAADGLKVEEGWEPVVELALGPLLAAVPVETVGAHAEAARQFGGVALVEPAAQDAGAARAGRLSGKVSGCDALAELLDRVTLADSFAEAMALRASLKPGQTVATRDGVWAGRHWLAAHKAGEGRDGVLVRRREMQRLARALDGCAAENAARAAELERLRAEADALEPARESERAELTGALERIAAAEAELKHRAAETERLRRRDAELRAELAAASQRRAAVARDCESSSQAARRAEEALAARERDAAPARAHAARREALQRAEAALDEARAAAHQAELDEKSARAGAEAARAHLAQLRAQAGDLTRRLRAHEDALAAANAPDDGALAGLDALLAERDAAAAALAEAERRRAAAREELQGLEARGAELRGGLEDMRKAREQISVELQVGRARRRELQRAAGDFEWPAEELLAELDDDAEADALERESAATQTRIERLGAINLAAMDEHEELAQRKEYLDSQHDDLTKALDALADAIAKIDRESRARFMEAFDRINEHLGRLFPRLFGGGEGRMELTGDDPLEAGVRVMARVPGKRLSSIHLMSGGEKALAAVAVVFSFFELAPAPFCLLDEVDAPLDEANVDRFSSLIVEMSQRVQFVVITHNKATMEYADNLIGVTMQEAGVSKRVSVDMEAAVKLATA